MFYVLIHENGSFNHLVSLDISHNKFETLEGMNLHLLPRQELDIRNNPFTDHLEVCSSLRDCHALKKIYVKSSLPGPFHNQKEYLNDMFLQMRGLDLIDNKSRPKAMYIKTFEKKAIEFENHGCTGLNGICYSDFSNKGLEGPYFPYILAALHQVKRLVPDIILRGNPLETKVWDLEKIIIADSLLQKWVIICTL